jgi:HD-GYP domain-containing protein (c-di-GMP phosphodiesterase class II)
MYKPLPLNTVELNTPVPVNIWDARGTLLLRKGESILSEQHRESLQQHSPMVRESDYQAWTYSYTTQLDRMVRGNQPLNRIAGLTRPSELTAVAGLDTTDPVLEWQDLQGSLGVLLHQGPGTSDFVDRLLRVEQKALRLLELGPDNTLFVLVQQLFDRRMGYSASHALTCAAVCHLGAPAAGLAPQEAASLFKAALTMNMGMARLHDDLSRQAQPPTPAQRQAIDDHPSRSVSLLRQVGVADPFWLQVVLRHHQPQAGPEPTAVA